MKFTKAILAMAITLGMTSGAQALNVPATGGGTITFDGAIITSACSIAPGGEDQTVNMGQIGTDVLNANTNTGQSTPVDFSIPLVDCVTDPGNNNTYTVTFTGPDAPGTASGDAFALVNNTSPQVGLYLQDSAGNDITPATATNPAPFAPGTQDIQFKAYVKNNGAAAVAGPFSTPVNFVMAWQ